MKVLDKAKGQGIEGKNEDEGQRSRTGTAKKGIAPAKAASSALAIPELLLHRKPKKPTQPKMGPTLPKMTLGGAR